MRGLIQALGVESTASLIGCRDVLIERRPGAVVIDAATREARVFANVNRVDGVDFPDGDADWVALPDGAVLAGDVLGIEQERAGDSDGAGLKHFPVGRGDHFLPDRRAKVWADLGSDGLATRGYRRGGKLRQADRDVYVVVLRPDFPSPADLAVHVLARLRVVVLGLPDVADEDHLSPFAD